uniref:NADH-ubiquinone oxidoreductase chain 4 n=1 Tax=Tinodes chinchinus TaxID=2904900 RepID=A0A9E8RTB3_9NEOP|nr:NADH dehydrogenase subunit 4 [Tinodes chinchinus]UZZ44424.1 NADH dehydrogenase subunit 4 [Tinodes chinchinus]
MLMLIMYMIFNFGLLFIKNYWIIMNSLMILIFFFFFFNYNLMFFFNLSYMFSMDILSMGLMMLSIWIIFLMIMVSYKILNYNYNSFFFLFNLLFLLLLLLLVFLSMNIFMFYLFFEISLIPVLFLIIGWGYQVERIQAGIYLLFYTLFLSLPMLLGLIYIYMNKNYLMIFFIKNLNSLILYLILMLSFLVKMPMFMLHLWLLKAHVEAPISGSMILAGLMLKLGGYGMIRVMNFFLIYSLKLNFFFIIISLVGGIYLSMMCFMQIDMKLLIALSSVVHMALVIIGLMSMSYFGMSGSYVIMLGHGLCSSGLFVLSNFCYERLFSRSMMLNTGMINLMPLLSLWWFLLISCNMSSPPSLNLLGEISLLISIVNYSWLMMFGLMLINFFTAIYNLYLYSFVQHGMILNKLMSFSMINLREYLILFLHWFPLNFLIFKVDFLYLI